MKRTVFVVAACAALAISSCAREQAKETEAAPAPAETAAPANETALAIAAKEPSLAWGPCPPIFPAGCEIAVLRGDPTKPDADVFLRVPARYELPAHTHTSAERMVLATGELQVTYKGQPPATLRTGSYAYGPAGAPHKAACVSAEPCTLFIAFDTPVDALPYEGTLD